MLPSNEVSIKDTTKTAAMHFRAIVIKTCRTVNIKQTKNNEDLQTN